MEIRKTGTNFSPPVARPGPPLSPLGQDIVELLGQRPTEEPLRILFAHRSSTGGHAAAAKAMADELNKYPNVQAESLNLLSVASKKTQESQKKAFAFVTKTVPSLRKLGFDLAFKGSTIACGLAGLAIDAQARGAREELQAIQDRKPDLLVSTHSPTGRMLSYWSKRGQINAPIHSIPTDFRTHRMWKQDAIKHYYVAPGGSKTDLEGFGVKPEDISETGIPIRPIKVSPLSPPELKAQLGLDPNKPVVLVTGGSLGLQPFKLLVDQLEQLPQDFQIVCITAKNEQAKADLEALPQGQHPLHVTGLVNNMDEYIQACDVVLTKPGGLTCSEILAQKKPMVFAELYQGLETPLIARMVKAGVAVAGQTPAATAEKIGKLLEASQSGSDMQARVAELSRPDSARMIAEEMLRSLLFKDRPAS